MGFAKSVTKPDFAIKIGEDIVISAGLFQEKLVINTKGGSFKGQAFSSDQLKEEVSARVQKFQDMYPYQITVERWVSTNTMRFAGKARGKGKQ